ncbi:hypothetical protein SAMN06297387_12320 [Streptomyces zhaozhouensis]|uniref:Streptogrisin B n=1 Tax=Streptomyces zhaozhouensis TaxID=1300267 RepID=A0A286E492_9ACTN|nr:S1 family peptidase [Streptomyces zhaozhouensis]SOD65713.1 hypothetical protein SAMN06297387_12320 [Streptomyces zhaozhouensis]
MSTARSPFPLRLRAGVRPTTATPRPPVRVWAALVALVCLLAFPTGAAAQSAGAPADAVPLVAGGDTVFSDAGLSCTVVANLAIGDDRFGLLPGACTEGFPHWYADPQLTVPIGPTTGSTYPTHGLFAYENPAVPVEQTPNCGGAPLTSVGDPTVGQAVTRGGTTTGCHSGTVTALNVTINFGGGVVVSGLIETNLCMEPGDRNGPLTSGTTLLGIPVGGSGNCSSGGTTYYQPVAQVLAEYGATLV